MLRPGSHHLAQTQPTGYGDGPDTPGSAGGAAAGDTISGIAITPGARADGYLFTETRVILQTIPR
ncbi:hypothetical protein [Actinokineospora sp. UTMC 2448]|uniref:hypothetical protein n=1 Tax=Actinokineospora sp. UTMC 2448 TaxID=2268449 RepID=UPI0021648154|nr:hypothetical protein [Actinokineospora sp. UTMC 2448]UVS78420.1 hypothetical protein Actkin_02153 [Actinokineospora sp. UTMC 2448]